MSGHLLIRHSRVLCIDDDLATGSTTGGRRIRAIVEALRHLGVEVIESLSIEDGVACFVSDSAIHCVLVDWSLGASKDHSHTAATNLLRTVRKHNASVPIFLLADRKVGDKMTVEVAPSYDQSEITALAAAHIACDLLCVLRNRKLAGKLHV